MQYVLSNPLVILLLIIPILAIGWRSLAAIFVCVGCPLLILWIIIWWDFQSPGFDPGLFGMIGLAVFGISACGFFLMLLGRGAGVFLQSKGASRLGVVWIDVLSFCIFIFAPMGLLAFEDFSKRSPKEACVANGIPIEIGNTSYTLPHAGVITVYETDVHSAFYFFSNKNKRELCRKTANGTRSLKVSELWVKPGEIVSGSRDTQFCKNAKKPWERAACSHMFCRYDYQQFETSWTPFDCSSELLNLPNELWIGNKANWDNGDLSTMERATAKSDHKQTSGYLRDNDRFVRFDAIQQPDSTPLYMRCRSSYDSKLWCKTDMYFNNEIRMSWELDTNESDLQDDVKDTYAAVNTIINDLQN